MRLPETVDDRLVVLEVDSLGGTEGDEVRLPETVVDRLAVLKGE